MSIWVNGSNIVDDDFGMDSRPKFKRSEFVKNTAISIYLFFKQLFSINLPFRLWSKNKEELNNTDDADELLKSPAQGEEVVTFF